MPELPDITVYVEHLARRCVGARLAAIRLANPFLLRTVDPPILAATGRTVTAIRRLGKRIVFALDGDVFLVLHLMIAGRLQWKDRGAAIPGKVGHGAFDFETGTLLLTEASTRKRASLHVVRGDSGVRALDRGGLEVLDASLDAFSAALSRENHTLKRALTDPRLLSGIGNAYSDEILHRARLSPLKLTKSLDSEEVARLFLAAKTVLTSWTETLRKVSADAFPAKVTAFRDGMAAHGRFGQPCPDCGTAIQRIRYAENEADYCPRCQTGGKLLADRSLSRLLREDWPRTIEELEESRRAGSVPRPGT